MKQNDKIKIFSQKYKETINLYKNMHLNGTGNIVAEETFDGRSLKFFFHPIKQIIQITNSKSLIDFGCGKAKYYSNKIEINKVEYINIISYWGTKQVFLYDPGVKEFSKYPTRKADGVICIDVLEHIPEENIFEFIHEIFKLSKKFVFINIACYPAKKKFPDGRNVHLCIKKPEEWKKIFKQFKIKYPKISQFIICSITRKNFVTVS